MNKYSNLEDIVGCTIKKIAIETDEILIITNCDRKFKVQACCDTDDSGSYEYLKIYDTNDKIVVSSEDGLFFDLITDEDLEELYNKQHEELLVKIKDNEKETLRHLAEKYGYTINTKVNNEKTAL